MLACVASKPGTLRDSDPVLPSGDSVPPDSGSDDSALPPPPSQCEAPAADLSFPEVGSAWGLVDTTDADPGREVEGAVALGDVDGDGDDDLVLAQRHVGVWLQRNLGGAFDRALVSTQLEVATLAWGDVEDDGDLDLLVAGLSPEPELLLNDGTGGFTGTKIGVSTGPKRHAAFGDVDLDGDLDLLLAIGGAGDQSDMVLENDGAGGFTPRDEVLPPDPEGMSWTGTLSDLDGDGDPEVYVANAEQTLRSPSRLYRNDGGWSFTEVSDRCGCSTTGMSPMGASVGDLDGDALPDLFISNTGPSSLLQNQGDLSFVDVALAQGARVTEAPQAMSFAGTWLDHDNDGWQDLYVTLGPLHPPDDDLDQDPSQEDVLLVHGADGFEDHAPALGLADPGAGRGAAVGLLDGDGFLDLVVANLGEPSRLYVPPCTEARALVVDLVGTRSNRFGVGAVVTVYAGDRSWTREVTASAGWGSSIHPRVHVGLGDRTPDRLVVRWPGGGEQEVELGRETGLRVVVEEE